MMDSKWISPETIRLLSKVFRNVRWYKIGANAINMNFELREESEMRVTEDIDFAIYLQKTKSNSTVER
jgi:predicted nucleotidyltransferase